MTPIYKLIYRFYRLSSWAKYSFPRRFTRTGLGLMSAIGLCGLMVPDTENNLAYQAFSLLLCLLLLPLVFIFFFKAQVAVERALPRLATTGSKLFYSVRVRNLSKEPQFGLTVLENIRDPRPNFRDWLAHQLSIQRRVRSFRFSKLRRQNPFKLATVKIGELPAMGAGQEAETKIEVLPLRRGVLRFEGVTLARPDPFGIVRAFLRKPMPQSLLVLPKRYPLPPIAMPGFLKYQQGGVALASNVGQSDEFVSLRDYRHGDPVRHIHWRSWAKVGKPVVKEFEDEFFVRHALVLDTFTSDAYSDAFEEAVSVAASFACTLSTQESLLDLLFVGAESYCVTSGRGLAGADQMLEVLASVTPCKDHPFESLESLVLNHAQLVSGVVCILLAWDDTRRELVDRLRALGVSTLTLLVVDAGSRLVAEPPKDHPENFFVLEAGRIEEGLAQIR